MIRSLVAVLFGLTAGLLVAAFAGESPLNVLWILARSAVGSTYDLGMTLFYTTPLIFTGLSVAVAVRAGLFNIGGEGQLAIASLAVAALGMTFPNVPIILAPLLAIGVAFLTGGIWGGIAGYLRAYRGAHEVIATIMLNFVAAGVCSYLTLYFFPNPNSQNPETGEIGAAYQFAFWDFFEGAPLTLAFPIALLVAFGVWFFLERTVWGFEVKAVGANEKAARQSGIDSKRVRMLSMALAGALAGLVAVVEVLGNSYRFKLGFSPGYGFLGIAVALLGRGKPLGVVLAALLFGALHKGATDLDFETENVTRDLSLILQASVILFVSADGLYGFLKRRTSRG